MNNIVAQFGKIAAKSFLAWLKVIVGGGLLSIICFIVSIVLISNNSGPGFAGARAGIVGALMAIPYLFVVEFWTALLLFGSLGAMVFSMLLLPLHTASKKRYSSLGIISWAMYFWQNWSAI